MKVLILLFLFGALSWLVGLIVCGLLMWANRSGKAIGVAALVFFGAPFLVFYGISSKEWHEERQFKADVAYVQELCAKYGGDKIYRTVDNVEGVFQMTPRPPMTDAMWQDQYGMPDPWGKAQGDSSSRLKEDYPSIALGANAVGTGKPGYWFIEQRTAAGESALPYVRRIPSKGNEKGIYTSKLRSRYGYQTEDLSTPELRKRWIAGGWIKIIDLQTNEVLAERVGYFRAPGKRVLMHWAGSGAYGTAHMCPNKSRIDAFLRTVLRPPINFATPEQIELLKKD